MPQINFSNNIDITPEKFLRACSDTELQEVKLLLHKDIAANYTSKERRNFMEFPDKVRQFLSHDFYYQNLDKIKQLRPYEQGTFIDFLKCCGEEFVFEALEQARKISRESSLQVCDVLPLLKDFVYLEKVRLKSLAKRPQLLNSDNSGNS